MKYGTRRLGALGACLMICVSAADSTSLGSRPRKLRSCASKSASEMAPLELSQASLTMSSTTSESVSCLSCFFSPPLASASFAARARSALEETYSGRAHGSMLTFLPRNSVSWNLRHFFAAFRVLKSTNAKPLNFLFVPPPPARRTAWMSSAHPSLRKMVLSQGTMCSTLVSYGICPKNSVVISGALFLSSLDFLSSTPFLGRLLAS